MAIAWARASARPMGAWKPLIFRSQVPATPTPSASDWTDALRLAIASASSRVATSCGRRVRRTLTARVVRPPAVVLGRAISFLSVSATWRGRPVWCRRRAIVRSTRYRTTRRLRCRSLLNCAEARPAGDDDELTWPQPGTRPPIIGCLKLGGASGFRRFGSVPTTLASVSVRLAADSSSIATDPSGSVPKR